ncbi:MAG: HAD-IC family P-type ATPase [Mycobacteriaceae bacterium]|nr:HAD-IC family P-type ATPase [Mycobacteriaceae bacterium]
MTESRAIGLTAAEVRQRITDGKTNNVPNRVTRSAASIVRTNVFTRINALLTILLALVLATGSLINGLFGVLIVANSVIGIVQELRAKQTLDRLAIVGQAKPLVRRASSTSELLPSDVVLDDIIELGPGDQIIVDGLVVENSGLEVDESLLTGEADAVRKRAGDPVMSGSFVVAGTGAYRATKVGRDAYAAQLAAEASKFTLVRSELRTGINKILQFITYLMIPAGLLIIYTQLFTIHVGWRRSVLAMVGALVPMVPEGLVLMTSIAFAVGVVRLGRRQCLVQELPAIEGLARVNVVCADKTGTLTENRMQVDRLVLLDPAAAVDVTDVLASIAADDARPNTSIQALSQTYGNPPGWTPTATAPFKSATKWSGVSYGAHGNWILGAPDVLLARSSVVAAQAEAAGAQGLRVLLLGCTDLPVDHPDAPGRILPVALIMLTQKIRPDARNTLDYFAQQGVSIKLISGDNAVSVAAVASTLGLDQEPFDARKLPNDPDELAQTVKDYNVFGRVSPDQKRVMVQALKSRGNTVAMTGDGVNDVLALKDADIGVAMGAGSAAARAVAQIVLLDNKFATLPYVVGEGRRVIGNIERVSKLFLTKTVYSALLALFIGVTGLVAKVLGTKSLMFPFEPIQVTIAAWFTIGIPAFILSLAPNNERAQHGFVRRVMVSAVPNGTIAASATFGCYVLASRMVGVTPTEMTQASTSALITLVMIAVWVLAVIARPYTWPRVALVVLSGMAYVAIFAIPWAQHKFSLNPSNVALTAIALTIGAGGAALVEALWWLRGSPDEASTRWWRSTPAQ